MDCSNRNTSIWVWTFFERIWQKKNLHQLPSGFKIMTTHLAGTKSRTWCIYLSPALLVKNLLARNRSIRKNRSRIRQNVEGKEGNVTRSSYRLNKYDLSANKIETGCPGQRWSPIGQHMVMWCLPNFSYWRDVIFDFRSLIFLIVLTSNSINSEIFILSTSTS